MLFSFLVPFIIIISMALIFEYDLPSSLWCLVKGWLVIQILSQKKCNMLMHQKFWQLKRGLKECWLLTTFLMNTFFPFRWVCHMQWLQKSGYDTFKGKSFVLSSLWTGDHLNPSTPHQLLYTFTPIQYMDGL